MPEISRDRTVQIESVCERQPASVGGVQFVEISGGQDGVTAAPPITVG